MILATKELESRGCRGKQTRRVFVLQCDNQACAEIFERNFGSHLLSKQHFCSRKCINSGRVHTTEWKQALSLKNSGKANPFFGNTHTTQTLEIISEKAKQYYASLSAEEKQSRNKHLSSLNTGSSNHFFNKAHSSKSKALMSNTRATKIANGEIQGGPRGRKGEYQSKFSLEHYDSFFELFLMHCLDADESVIHWTKKHGIMIDYELAGKTRKYVPDFLVKRQSLVSLEEVKGYEEPLKLQTKILAGHEYALQHQMNFVIWDHPKLEELSKMNFSVTLGKLRKLWLG